MSDEVDEELMNAIAEAMDAVNVGDHMQENWPRWELVEDLGTLREQTERFKTQIRGAVMLSGNHEMEGMMSGGIRDDDNWTDGDWVLEFIGSQLSKILSMCDTPVMGAGMVIDSILESCAMMASALPGDTDEELEEQHLVMYPSALLLLALVRNYCAQTHISHSIGFPEEALLDITNMHRFTLDFG